MPPASVAAFVHPLSRHTSSEIQPTNRGTPTLSSALPPRSSARPAALVHSQGRTEPSSAPVVPQGPAVSQRSLLSRHATAGSSQQHAMAAASALTAARSLDTSMMTRGRLHAIPETTEELLEEAPQYLQQDLATAYMAEAGQGRAAPAVATEAASASAAVIMAPSAVHQEAAAAAPSAGSPRAAAHAQSRHLQAAQSRSEQQHSHQDKMVMASASILAATAAPDAGPADAFHAAPLSLLQLAESEISLDLQPGISPTAATQHQPALSARLSTQQQEAQHARQRQVSTAQRVWSGEIPEGSVAGAPERQQALGPNADAKQLQGLQAALVQTLTSTVESAMAQMRSVLHCTAAIWQHVCHGRIHFAVTCLDPN